MVLKLAYDFSDSLIGDTLLLGRLVGGSRDSLSLDYEVKGSRQDARVTAREASFVHRSYFENQGQFCPLQQSTWSPS